MPAPPIFFEMFRQTWSETFGTLPPPPRRRCHARTVSLLWHCWLGHLTRKNPSPICVWWDVKPCSIYLSLGQAGHSAQSNYSGIWPGHLWASSQFPGRCCPTQWWLASCPPHHFMRSPSRWWIWSRGSGSAAGVQRLRSTCVRLWHSGW